MSASLRPFRCQAVHSLTGRLLASFEFGAIDVHGLEWAGGYLWALDNFADVVYQVDPTGGVRGVFALPEQVFGSLAFDGTHFWTNIGLVLFQVDLPVSETVPIPAVSQWGIVAMTLLVLSTGTVVLTRRCRPRVV